MSERIKNFKYFKYTLIVVLVVGMVLTVYNMKNSINGEVNKYNKNKDRYDYSIDISYDKVTPDRIIAGEEVYLNKDESALYEKSRPIAFIKKTSRLAFQDKGIKEAEVYYDAKYLENKNNITNEFSSYRNIKKQLVDGYIKQYLSEKKYLTTSNTFFLETKDNNDYIKEIIYFIDAEKFNIVKMIEINAKYNYKKDNLEYMELIECNEEDINSINSIVNSAKLVYNEIDSKKEYIEKKIHNEHKFKPSKMYIYDRMTVIGSSEDNEKSIKYNFVK